MARNGSRADSVLLFPGESEWEEWSLRPHEGEAFRIPKEGAERRGLSGASRLVALPAVDLIAIPLRFEVRAHVVSRDVIGAQLDRRGLLSRAGKETVFDFCLSEEDATETRALVLVAAREPEGQLLASDPSRFDAAFRFLLFPPRKITFWRELGKIVIGVGGVTGVAVVQSTPEATITPEVCRETRCLSVQLAAEGIAGAFDGVVLWGSFSEEETGLLGTCLGLPIERTERPAPRFFEGKALDLSPVAVRLSRASRERKKRGRRWTAGLLGIYVLGLALLSAHVGWLRWRIHRISGEIAQNAPLVHRMERTADRWEALTPALDPATYPLEILFECSHLLPEQGARLTLFERKDGRVFLTGEAANASMAIRYFEAIKQARELAAWRWEMPQPRLLPNDIAQFQIIGVSFHAAP